MKRDDGTGKGEDEPGRSAVALGATGAVGREVVKALLASPAFSQVTILVRRPLDIPVPDGKRLSQHVLDVFDAAAYEPLLAGHTAAFCTLGLGEPSKVNPAELRRVDVGGAEKFAAACRRQGVSHFSLLTSVGAKAKSSSYYLGIKGEIEAKVKALGFPRVSFFRPSLLVTPSNRYGALQGWLLKWFPRLEGALVGPLRIYRSIRVEELGTAMVRNAERTGMGVEILHWPEFKSLLTASP